MFDVGKTFRRRSALWLIFPAAFTLVTLIISNSVDSHVSPVPSPAFADAQTLKLFNASFVSRNRHEAKPGDLLFFYQPYVQKFPYHVMIFLGEASNASEGQSDWVVYHTGAAPEDGGAVKKVRLAVLDHHPNPRWRPTLNNPNFLGFYRLKLLDQQVRQVGQTFVSVPRQAGMPVLQEE